jgi:hypothetical protein
MSYTTLPSTANLVNLLTLSNGLWAADLDGNIADVFTGAPQTFLRSIPLAPTPVMIIGATTNLQRAFGISQGNVSGDVACNLSPTTGPTGEADGIEMSSDTISSRITLGQVPGLSRSRAAMPSGFLCSTGAATPSR